MEQKHSWWEISCYFFFFFFFDTSLKSCSDYMKPCIQGFSVFTAQTGVWEVFSLCLQTATTQYVKKRRKKGEEKKNAELTIKCILHFCISSSGDQQLDQIKLSFNEHKEVPRTSLESLQAASGFWGGDSREWRWSERKRRRQREKWASRTALARLKGQRLSIV